jgi:hypothetical protein
MASDANPLAAARTLASPEAQREMILSFPDGERAVLGPPPQSKGFPIALFAIAAAGFAVGGYILHISYEPVSSFMFTAWLVQLVCLMFFPSWLVYTAAACLMKSPKGPVITLDTTTHGVEFRERAASIPEVVLPLSHVVAVEMCAGIVRLKEGLFDALELNLALSYPPGGRFFLSSYSDPYKLRADAEELARFLKVPVLDHIDAAGEARESDTKDGADGTKPPGRSQRYEDTPPE